MPEWQTRRQYLTAAGLVSMIGVSGCLRLTDTSETEQQSTEPEQQSTNQSDARLQVASKTGRVSDGAITELNLTVLSSGGNINIGSVTITTIGADGSSTLTYNSGEAQAGSTFTLEAVQDEDDSLPVLTDTDRFMIIIDPGTLETGETMTLEMTTDAGATTEVRISIPNTLSGESAVQV